MRLRPKLSALALAVALVLGIAGAATRASAADPEPAFSISFDWGDIPRCDSGHPGVVVNPMFEVEHVPAGTRTITFRLKDLDAPAYHHGGGTVNYRGQPEVAPGAFTYNSPCPPPGETHTYQWIAVAKDARGNALATATARKPYP